MRLRTVGAFKNIRDAKGNAFGPHTHHQDTLLLFPDPHLLYFCCSKRDTKTWPKMYVTTSDGAFTTKP